MSISGKIVECCDGAFIRDNSFRWLCFGIRHGLVKYRQGKRIFYIDNKQVTPHQFTNERTGMIDLISNTLPFNIKLVKILLFEYMGLIEEITKYKEYADLIRLNGSKTLSSYISMIEGEMKKN